MKALLNKNAWVALAILFALPNAFAAQTFTGKAVAYDDVSTCANISNPQPQLAEADAAKQATEFCGTFSMTPSRVSEFTHEQGRCVPEGKGFAFHFSLYTYAVAQYNCQP